MAFWDVTAKRHVKVQEEVSLTIEADTLQEATDAAEKIVEDDENGDLAWVPVGGFISVEVIDYAAEEIVSGDEKLEDR
jgi:hypothetical protein